MGIENQDYSTGPLRASEASSKFARGDSSFTTDANVPIAPTVHSRPLRGQAVGFLPRWFHIPVP